MGLLVHRSPRAYVDLRGDGAPPTRIERAASRLTTGCSTTELRGQVAECEVTAAAAPRPCSPHGLRRRDTAARRRQRAGHPSRAPRPGSVALPDLVVGAYPQSVSNRRLRLEGAASVPLDHGGGASTRCTPSPGLGQVDRAAVASRGGDVRHDVGRAHWWRRQDSNLLPSACEADALPGELHPHGPH